MVYLEFRCTDIDVDLHRIEDLNAILEWLSFQIGCARESGAQHTNNVLGRFFVCLEACAPDMGTWLRGVFTRYGGE